jgi:ribosome-associated heat shock protein Hsp15
MEHTFQFFSEDDTDTAELEEPLKPGEERTLKVRLDKWLWAARFFKTRAVARAAVEKGKVFYNGQRSKPSREIEIGATLQIRQGRYEKIVIVKGLSTRRRSTEEALQLFEETEESRLNSEKATEWSHSSSSEHRKPIDKDGQSAYLPILEQPRERRVVRFLRRSLARSDQSSRRDRLPSYSNKVGQNEFDTDE